MVIAATGPLMIEPMERASPRLKARIAGAFYLMNFLGFAPGVFASARLVVADDAAATAANILAHPALFRLGFACDLVGAASYVAVTVLFHELFTVVNRSVSLVAASLSVVGCGVVALGSLFHVVPFLVLEGPHHSSAFTVEQGQALALMGLKLCGQCFNISFVFFGFYCVLIGYLIFRSRFLPRILGAGMTCAGVAWLTFLSPALAHHLSPYLLAPGVVGEGSLTLWLLVAGVSSERWREQAGAAGGPRSRPGGHADSVRPEPAGADSGAKR